MTDRLTDAEIGELEIKVGKWTLKPEQIEGPDDEELGVGTYMTRGNLRAACALPRLLAERKALLEELEPLKAKDRAAWDNFKEYEREMGKLIAERDAALARLERVAEAAGTLSLNQDRYTAKLLCGVAALARGDVGGGKEET